MRQRGVCPGFGGSDLEKEYESGWGRLPVSSAWAVGTECQAVAAAASTQSSAPAAPGLGEGVGASSIQNGAFTPSYPLSRGRDLTPLAWLPS